MVLYEIETPKIPPLAGVTRLVSLGLAQWPLRRLLLRLCCLSQAKTNAQEHKADLDRMNAAAEAMAKRVAAEAAMPK